MMSASFARTLNVVGLFGLAGLLSVAFYYQIALSELPCPLCLLQRVGFVAAGVGLVLNLTVGLRPSHYALVILSAMAGAMVSIRQIELHIVPGTGTYGSALFGMHFYTWALIGYAAMIAAAAVMMLFDRQFEEHDDGPPLRLGMLERLGIAVFILLALGNGVSTFAECGFGMCPDNPTGYMNLFGG